MSGIPIVRMKTPCFKVSNELTVFTLGKLHPMIVKLNVEFVNEID
jgi:hypothetical protein